MVVIISSDAADALMDYFFQKLVQGEFGDTPMSDEHLRLKAALKLDEWLKESLEKGFADELANCLVETPLEELTIQFWEELNKRFPKYNWIDHSYLEVVWFNPEDRIGKIDVMDVRGGIAIKFLD